MNVAHLAGVAVHFDGRLRQRCEWCGAVLVDMDLRNVMVLETDADKPLPEWPQGAFVLVNGGVSVVVEPGVSEVDAGPTPPLESCMRLDPEVTA